MSIDVPAVIEGPERAPRNGSAEALVFATIATRAYLGQALTAIRTFLAHHRDAKVLLMVVDAVDAPRDIDPAWKIVTPADLAVPDFAWLALKFDAVELCCAMKPYLLMAALEIGDKVIYADADLAFFAPCDAMLAALDDSDFVVTPHIVAPFPDPERFGERPTLGTLTFSGQLNAGLIGIRRGPEAERFLPVFAAMCTQPGACQWELGPQTDQNSLNWITAFADGVRILRDTAYNVSYWNLHDRSLRWNGLDNIAKRDSWSVDGQPLVCFHFSGYDPNEPYRLSRHDRRYSIYHLPSIERMLRRYDEMLAKNGHETYARIAYRFATLPDGTPIGEHVRRVLRKFERTLTPPADPWSEQGAAETVRMLTSPVPGAKSFLPLPLADLFELRPDLRQAWRTGDLCPIDIWNWIAESGAREYDFAPLFDRHRRVLKNSSLTELLDIHAPTALDFGAEALGRERLAFADALELEDKAHADIVRQCRGEIPVTCAAGTILDVYNARPDLQGSFPEPLGDDLDAFCRWTRANGPREYGIPAEHAERLRACGRGASMTRLYSFLRRTENLTRENPFALVGEDWEPMARELLGIAAEGLEFDADDVAVFIWTMRHRPHEGLRYLLELPSSRRAVSSPRTEAGARRLLGDRLDRPAFAEEFRRYQMMFSASDIAWEDAYLAVVGQDNTEGLDVFADIRAAHREKTGSSASTYVRAADRYRRSQTKRGQGFATPPPFGFGVNMFGSFASPIGVGHSAWGLSKALDAIGAPQARHVTTTDVMPPDMQFGELVERYRYDFDTNLFVSFPHAMTSNLQIHPRAYTQGRRNIAYLAWEQRDWSELWRPVYDRYDDVWAISEFAARPMRELFGDRVKVVPNVVDMAALPSAASKSETGLDPEGFSFLYVFDANSSMERKNPLAAIKAFIKAFSGTADANRVELILKVGNAQRRPHAMRLRALRAQVEAAGLRIRMLTEMMSRDELMQLISACDCYVSLHRSEGFGYTCAEAMAYARPVIATNYSGNLEFMDASCSLLVDAREELVRLGEGPFPRGSIWAEADTDMAAEMMRQVLNDASLRRRIGNAARDAVISKLTPAVVGERLRGYLGQ